MRFVRGRYYCITKLTGNTYHCLVEFRSRTGSEYYMYSLTSSDPAYVDPNKADKYIKINVKKVRDPARCSIKEVSTVDLLLYFGDYVGRRYKDILSGKEAL
jgi:hypothetical protein